MTKNDVYDFVQKVKSKAIASIEEKNKKALSKEKGKIYKKYKKDIERINNASREIGDATASLIEKLKADKEFSFKDRYMYSSSFEGSVKNIIRENAVHSIFEDNGIKHVGGVKEERDRASKEVSMVKVEYDKVYTKCRELKSAKKCIEYLNELGFDTSSLEVKKESKLEVKDINKDMLFVCGDNK